jgi:cysteine synthase A
MALSRRGVYADPDRMAPLPKHLLDCIGNTPLLPLRKVVPRDSARILVKVESANPTGSMKDRMALAMVEAAEADGRLTSTGVVEYTTGNTGIALSMICAVKGHPLQIVTSDAYAPEKRDHMAILGARLVVLESDDGRMTERLTRDMIARARAIAADTGAFWTDQLRNADQLPAFRAMAREIGGQVEGPIDAFVQAIGSGACFRGNAEELRARYPDIRTVAVEPAESAVLAGRSSGAHKIDGMGAGFVVPLWKPELATSIEHVATDEAFDMSLRLAREEGLFGGASTGANVAAAIRVARHLGPGATVVTVLCDTGTRYLSAFGSRVKGPVAISGVSA